MQSKSKSDFFDAVYNLVRLVPYGRVTTYGAIAKALGASQAARLVGYAMNASHSQIIPVPAHRVVNRNGLLTGKMHFGTPTAMQEALHKEGIAVKDNQIVHFKELFWDPQQHL